MPFVLGMAMQKSRSLDVYVLLKVLNLRVILSGLCARPVMVV